MLADDTSPRAVHISADDATLQFGPVELAILSDLLGQRLGYQEEPPRELPAELRGDYDRMYTTFNATLTAIGHEEERRGPPFAVGERVEVARLADLRHPDLGVGAQGLILSCSAPDPVHDYDWCLVRLDSGRDVELAALEVRRL